jgi:cupin fold WbuC family metalloprotein
VARGCGSFPNPIVVSIAVADKYRTLNPEVLYTRDALTKVDRSEIDHFKQLSSANPRKRVRLCAHADPEDRLHEMLIVHERGAYVRPHKHPGKTESTHIIEGMVDVVVFDDHGHITDVLSVGDYASGRTFYYRMAVPAFHTLLIRSDVLVFHEITNGPFDRSNTVFAPWAPADHDTAAVEHYVEKLEGVVRALQAKKGNPRRG